ncbi:MAG TPA: hypothetical protein VFG86_07000, partial [Chloroflexota bacterium]|nr:hypothetical protein [Chloroflexota bacterium]
MTLPDPNLDRPGGADQGNIDRLPPSERGQDEVRTETTHGLASEGSRPLTSEENAAAEHDTGVAERVYAPASERVPVPPVPGHRDFVEHTDEATPERQAAQPTEPSFTRVDRSGERDWSSDFTAEESQSRSWLGLPVGFGSAATIACGAVAVWLYVRWQRERNKPINRFRRQAMHTASELRERVPEVDELRQPAGYGAAASLLPMALLVWRILRSREPKPLERVTDADWQQRLT